MRLFTFSPLIRFSLITSNVVERTSIFVFVLWSLSWIVVHYITQASVDIGHRRIKLFRKQARGYLKYRVSEANGNQISQKSVG